MIQPRWRVVITLVVILIWVAINVVYYQTTAMPGWGLRYLFLPLVVLAVLIFFGVRYVQASYSFDSWRDALDYYLACLFDLQRPLLVVNDGKAQVPLDKVNTLLKIGGPGAVIIRPGSVVLVEDYSGNVHVLRAGFHYIPRQEIIKEITGLEERHAEIERLSATAKDGLEVAAQDIRYRYQVYRESDQTDRKPPTNLLSYSDEAVIRMTYNRPITQGGISNWHSVVNQVVESIIIEFIRGHSIDYLTAPTELGVEARNALYDQFYSPNGINRFRAKGAELIWIDIGHFETQDKAASEQRLTTWQARWQGSAKVDRAIGEAARTVFMDEGRAEGQASIVANIIEGLTADSLLGAPNINMRSLYLARIAKMLDDMTTQSFLSKNQPPNES